LLLQLLEVVLVGAALDQVVDVEQVALGRDVEAGVLLADATVPAGREGARRRVGPHALGSGPRVHLLLVEGHPVRVGVRGHGLLGRRLGEDGTRADAVHGESVVLHLLVGGKGSSKVTGSKGVQWLGGCRRPGAGVVVHGPCLLAVGSGLVGGQAGKGVVALLGEEGVVAVCVDDGAAGGAVDKVAGVEVLPDGGVGREDALGAGGGRHEDGRVQDVGVERGVVVEAVGRGLAVHVVWVGGGKVHGGLL
jgi:hypothetical protein